jgi:hypothetical protein
MSPKSQNPPALEHETERPSTRQRIRKILLVVTVFLLGLAIPLAIKENMIHATIYLFTDRFWDDLILRFRGAGRFRFLLQPGTAIVLGWIGGRNDTAQGRHGFLGRLIFRHAGWRDSLTHAIDAISILLIMGILADIVFQFVLLGVVHVMPALVLGPLFISVPYAVCREITSRLKPAANRGESH